MEGKKRKSSGIPTYQGQLLQEILAEQRSNKDAAQKEKQEAQQIIKISLSALIKRALKARNEALKARKSISPFPVPTEYIEALKLHCNHNAKTYSEESIYLEFYNVVEKELSLEHFPLQCLYLLDTFLHISDCFRSIVAGNINHLISVLERIGMLRPSNSNSVLKECQDYLLEIVDLWTLEYGSTHKSFVMVKRFLRETLHLNIPHIEERIAEIEKKKMINDETKWTLLVDSSERILFRSWPDVKQEIDLLFQRLDESFQALLSSTAREKNTHKESVQVECNPTIAGQSCGIIYKHNVLHDSPSKEQIQINSPLHSSSTDANAEWEDIQWESDEIQCNSFADDDYSADDLFGEDLLYASAAFSGDLTIIVDPFQVSTHRGQPISLDPEAQDRYHREIRQAVATATKHLVSLYKLIQKWKKLLERFIVELHRLQQNHDEYIRFWQHHKKRRRLIPETTGTINAGVSASTIHDEAFASGTLDGREMDNVDPSFASKLLGKDCALLERMEKAVGGMLENEIPATMQSIRSLVDNQIRAVLYTGSAVAK